MSKIDWDIRITFNNLMVALVSIPLILTFMVLSYQLITTAFVDDQVREDIEAYIAVLGILSGPAYMAISDSLTVGMRRKKNTLNLCVGNIKPKMIFGERKENYRKTKNLLSYPNMRKNNAC